MRTAEHEKKDRVLAFGTKRTCRVYYFPFFDLLVPQGYVLGSRKGEH